MITTASLKSSTVKDLTELAKSTGLTGWHSMKKDQLVRALLKFTRKPASKPAARAAKTARVAAASVKAKQHQAKLHQAKQKRSQAVVKVVAKVAPKQLPKSVSGGKPVNGAKPINGAKSVNGTKPIEVAKSINIAKPINGTKPTNVAEKINGAKSDRISRKIHAAHEKRERRKDLSVNVKNGQAKSQERDRIVLMVRDAYWLHVLWHVTRTTVMRAQAAMAEHWHTAKPILRLIEVDAGPTTSTAERVVREIDVHGGVQNWYVDVPDPPHSYRVELGYKSATGKFFAVARSNMVSTPAPGASDSIDENWSSVAQDYEKVYAMSGGNNEERSSGELQELFEERLRRPMGPASAKFGVGAERLLNRHKDFRFDIDAELIIYGATSADARVTLGGEPVKLRSDGTFTVRMAMPDKRQVIPAVSASADGVEQRTIVLAVERNTKILEPMVKEQNEQ